MTIAKSELEQKILELVEACIHSQGYRVVDIDCHISGRSVVRLFIEQQSNEDGFGRATVEDCEKVSRLVGPLFDVEDVIPGAYDLEVSSPGLDRRLRISSDFDQVVGNEVKLRLHAKIEGVGSSPRGHLKRVGSDRLVMDVSGAEFEIPFSSIRRANLIWGDPSMQQRKGTLG